MKINVKKTEELAQALEQVQQRCRSRTISPADVTRAIEIIELRTGEFLYKKDQIGLVFNVDIHHHSFTRKFNRSMPISTQFSIELCKSGWFVTSIHRSICEERLFTCTNLAVKEKELSYFAVKTFHRESILPL